ncbi:TetR/AcrR family transcriptional regulator [Staphylococcus capitis]|uniref:TetR/AcrR family transcriptional regulator n=1 Tax=Staphylococcus TaxID=1279 RepID=UPI0008A37AA8|nr:MULTISPECIES: TetR/AcrR family transcriptional regulator [Staphylococcus]MDS3978748.1 TetR/AcrR family transcriptional regulator [Staphylococcus capitis]OFM90129.1 TetR family transcriptional regulator [Staphylococcus sp. HMSC055A09]
MKQRAKYKIIQSLIELLEEYPFEDITIKMICAYSNVNRSTFYDHFQDKYHLLERIQNYHLDKYKALLNSFYHDFHSIKQDQKKMYKFFLLVASYIKRREAFYKATLITHPNKDIALDYINETRDCYEKVMNRYETSIQNKHMFVVYSVGGQAGIIIDWLRRGCVESPKVIAEGLLANTIKLQR